MAYKRQTTLTPRQAAFVREFLVDKNGGAAAIRAGYAPSGAYEEAYRLLRHARVRHEIQKAFNRMAKSRGIKAETVLNRLDDIAGFDPSELFDENGHFLTIHSIPPELRLCIKEMDVRAEWDGSGPDKTKVAQITKLKFFDRVKANELIGKQLAMFQEQLTVKHEHSLESLVAGVDEPKDVTPRLEGEIDVDEDDQ